MTSIEYLLEKMRRDIVFLFPLILRNQLISVETEGENKDRKEEDKTDR
jgi:hypothetical protein